MERFYGRVDLLLPLPVTVQFVQQNVGPFKSCLNT